MINEKRQNIYLINTNNYTIHYNARHTKCILLLVTVIAKTRHIYNIIEASRIAYCFSSLVFMKYPKFFASISILYCLSFTKVLDYLTAPKYFIESMNINRFVL